MELPRFDLTAERHRIPLLATAEAPILLNSCSQGPQTAATLAAAEAYMASWRQDGMDWARWMAEVEAARAAFARLIGAAPGAVAVTTSVSAATASVASAMNFQGERRRVVVSAAEFPTVAQVWHAQERHGAEIVWAEDGAAITAALDERTLLVSACHADYRNGRIQDLETLARQAHAAGALLYADAYQTLGVRPVDVQALGVDFLASGNLKYLLGTPGIAFLYVRPELLGGRETDLSPTNTGWFGRRNPFAFDSRSLDWALDARRFDTGTPPVLNAYIARAGMEEIERVGPAAIEAWASHLGRRLAAGGAARGLELLPAGEPKTPSTAFRCDDAHAVEEALRQRGILTSAREQAIRLAPHYFNTEAEVDAALDALAEVQA